MNKEKKMNNINKPLVHKIKQPGTFSGKILLGFLQSVFKEITGNYIPSAYPLSIIEPYFTSDEQGESFWSNALAINVLEIRLKYNYNIHLIQKSPYILLVIEDIDSFKTGVIKLFNDLLDPEKKYLIYRDFIKTYRNMTPVEKIDFFKKKTVEGIAAKK